MYRLRELARLVEGRVLGDPEVPITGVQPFERAQEGDLTLAGTKKYWFDLSRTQASAVIVPLGVSSRQKNLLQVDQPKLAFARLLAAFHHKPFQATGISPLAHIGKDCKIPEQVSIHPFVYLGNDVVLGERVTLLPGVYIGDQCSLGSDCVLHPNVTLYENLQLGRRVVIHSGTVIGADGFGYVFDGQQQVKIEQTGTVELGADVEIGANSCVDRATFGSTIIEPNVKLDNHVHIGHNCRIGKNTVIVAQVGISGSVDIGENCVLAGQAGVIDHIHIGDNVTVMVKTAVTKDIPSDSTISGQPAMDHRQTMKIQALTRRLPELYQDWKAAADRPEGDKGVRDE